MPSRRDALKLIGAGALGAMAPALARQPRRRKVRRHS